MTTSRMSRFGGVFRYLLPVILFLLTFATTTVAGASFGLTSESARTMTTLDVLLNGMKYSVPLMLILTAHEMGHYVYARYYGIACSPPFFIPMPFLNMFGTMGAVIVMRERMTRKHEVFDVGAAGPIAGFIVALPVMVIGVALSEVQYFDPATPAVSEGNNVLYWLAKYLIHGEFAPHHDINTHPMAWAGWLGMLVTTLNMMPVGQLDGGHIAYAMFGRGAERLSRAFHRMVWLMGLTGLAALAAVNFGYAPADTPFLYFSSWIVWAILLRFIGHRHPPVDDEEVSLSAGRRVVGWVCFLIGALTFTPMPLRELIPVGPPAGVPREVQGEGGGVAQGQGGSGAARGGETGDVGGGAAGALAQQVNVTHVRLRMIYVADDDGVMAQAEPATATQIAVEGAATAGSQAVDKRPARERVVDAMRRARAGEEFVALAREYAVGNYHYATAGLAEWVDRAGLAPELVGAAFAMQPGDMRGPLRVTRGAKRGWYVLFCEGVRLTDGTELRLAPNPDKPEAIPL